MNRDAFLSIPYLKSVQFERLIFHLVKNEHHALPWTPHFHHHQLLIARSHRRAGSDNPDEALHLQTPAQDKAVPFNCNANNPH